MTTPRPFQRVTITTVARAAGVAPSTVSRAFTNPQRVNVLTREHVLGVARRLGYAPNPVAQALESGRSNTVALVVPDITNPYFGGVITGAERAAAQARLTLVLADSQESAVREEELVRRLAPGVDGLVLAAPRMPAGPLHDLAERHPIVLVNRALPGVSGVVADFDGGTAQIVAHLASLGHRSFVYAGGPAESWSGARRWNGLQAAARIHGITATRFGPYAPQLSSGPAAADAALAAGASAIVAHNDMLAIGVLQRLAERRIAVPAEISVIGFDDIFGADFCHPPLTTLAERTIDAGSRAVEALQVRLHATASVSEAPVRVLPTQLIVRGSSGTAPTVL